VGTYPCRGNGKAPRRPSKGTASYYDVVVDGARNGGAAWYYPEPKEAAAEIKDRVAFWRGVQVTEARTEA
jgi:uncharacterized protein (DUF427 family)